MAVGLHRRPTSLRVRLYATYLFVANPGTYTTSTLATLGSRATNPFPRSRRLCAAASRQCHRGSARCLHRVDHPRSLRRASSLADPTQHQLEVVVGDAQTTVIRAPAIGTATAPTYTVSAINLPTRRDRHRDRRLLDRQPLVGDNPPRERSTRTRPAMFILNSVGADRPGLLPRLQRRHRGGHLRHQRASAADRRTQDGLIGNIYGIFLQRCRNVVAGQADRTSTNNDFRV